MSDVVDHPERIDVDAPAVEAVPGVATPEGAPVAAQVPSPFAPVVVGGRDMDLTHLYGFDFTFDTAKRQGVKCFITFSTHCFSDKYDAVRHPVLIPVVDDRGIERCFDQERYDLSLGLKALLAGLPNSKVYQTREANFAIVTTRSGREYRVFFNVRKMEQKKRLRLYVESAYSPDAERGEPTPVTSYQRVKFNLLCDTILDGKPAKFHGR